ncbi:MAG: GGDEF domain-containing protein, partial [Methyloligellaceae bacterium]
NNMAEYNEVLEKRLANSKKQIDELQMSLELTRLESFIDEMTGLANRKRFDQTLELDMSEAKESGDPLCLLMIDIDHFKAFNDIHGHQTGDKVLRLVGQILKTNVKGRDCAARFGGEEFAILLPKTTLAAAVTLSEQIRAAIKSKELVKKSTNESLGHVTFSIGVSAYRSGESVQEFIERADVCLYAAKGAGRDNVKAETDLSTTSMSAA